MNATRPRRAGRWLVSAAATAVSTYALEAFATAAGVLLAASGLLAGLDRPVLVGVLAFTYVIWAAGLRVSLAANWSLLARTGTSTNVVSKAAHDLARVRDASARVLRLAAAAGYVVCELAKEVPYYAGAFGAELASAAISSGDALIFLAGTNLGAGLYEYALARVTRTFLGLTER